MILRHKRRELGILVLSSMAIMITLLGCQDARREVGPRRVRRCSNRLRLGWYDEALRKLAIALEFYSEIPGTEHRQADCYYQMGKSLQAKGSLAEALQKYGRLGICMPHCRRQDLMLKRVSRPYAT